MRPVSDFLGENQYFEFPWFLIVCFGLFLYFVCRIYKSVIAM